MKKNLHCDTPYLFWQKLLLLLLLLLLLVQF